MGVALAFAVGYVVGVRGGRDKFDEVVEALKTIRDSDEVAAMIEALRGHLAYLLREVSDLTSDTNLTSDERIERLRTLARNIDPRSSAS